MAICYGIACFTENVMYLKMHNKENCAFSDESQKKGDK